jgi:hypothetical protein
VRARTTTSARREEPAARIELACSVGEWVREEESRKFQIWEFAVEL